MRPKFASNLVTIWLSLAGSLLCNTDAAAQILNSTNLPTKTKTDAVLSYEGRLAISVAQELVQQKKYVEALKQADNAVRADPKSGTPHMVRAFILDKLGESKKAGNAFNKAISLSPNDGYIRYEYANHLCGMKDFAKADENYLLAAKDGNYPFPHKAYESAAACSYKAEKMDTSETHARAALAIQPESAVALSTMAMLLYSQSRYFEARAFIQRREALGPLDITLLELAYKIEKAAGDDRAAAQYQKQLDLMSQAQIQPPTGEGQKKP